MAGDPMHPIDDAAELARSLTEADLTGTGETPPASPFTVGQASKARAYAQATAPGDAMRGNNLVEAYKRWSAQQAAAAKAAPAAADLEAKALRKARKRYAKRLAKGASPIAASAAAFERYKEAGGRSGFPVFARKASV